MLIFSKHIGYFPCTEFELFSRCILTVRSKMWKWIPVLSLFIKWILVIMCFIQFIKLFHSSFICAPQCNIIKKTNTAMKEMQVDGTSIYNENNHVKKEQKTHNISILSTARIARINNIIYVTIINFCNLSNLSDLLLQGSISLSL